MVSVELPGVLGERLQLQQTLTAFKHNPLNTNSFLEGSVIPLPAPTMEWGTEHGLGEEV